MSVHIRFSEKEKNQVLLVLRNVGIMDANLLENDEVWETLGEELGRPAQEVREAFEEWGREQPTDPELPKEESSEEFDVILEADRIILEAQVQEGLSQDDTPGPQLLPLEVQRPLADLNNLEFDPRDIAYEFFEGRSNDQFSNLITKRQRETEKFHEEAIESFRNQSVHELELKRREHEKKMELYDKKLRNEREVHSEKMKILRNKLEFTEKQLRHIEHVMSDRNQRKRFRSGSDD